MSFTNPLWNDMLFEKINEMHHIYMELGKQMGAIHMRLNTLENKLANVSNVVSHMSSLFSHPVASAALPPISVSTPYPSQRPQSNPSIPIPEELCKKDDTHTPPGLRSSSDTFTSKNVLGVHSSHAPQAFQASIPNTSEKSDERDEETVEYEGEWTKVTRKRK